MSGSNDKFLNAMLAFFCVMLGGITFWSDASSYWVIPFLGWLLMVAGLGWQLLQLCGPYEEHHGHGHGAPDPNLNPHHRGFKVTLYGRLMVEFVIGFTIARFVVTSGKSGLGAFSTWGLWFVAVSALTYAWSLRSVPNHPASVAQISLFDRRITACFKPEGLRDFPLLGLLFTYTLQNVQTVDFDIGGDDPDKPAFDVTTPDKVPSTMDGQVIFEVSDPIMYHNNEEMKGVMARLYATMSSRLREWAISGGEGPDGWFALKASRIFALNAIARALFEPDQLPHIDNAPPTEFLLRWVEAPGWPRTDRPSQIPQERWDGWIQQYNGLSDAEKERVNSLLADRRKILQDLNSGNAHLKIEALGIVVTRISLMKVKTEQKIEDAASDAEKEKLEKASQKIEQENVVALAAAMMKPAPDGLGLDAREAVNVAQRITAKLKSDEQIVTLNFSSGTQAVAELAAKHPEIAAALAALAVAFKKGGK